MLDKGIIRGIGACTLALAGALATGAVLAEEGTPAAQERVTQFDLEAGPLADTLLNISRLTGQPISFDQALVQGYRSPAIHGALSRDQALAAALRDSGLSYSRIAGGAVLIHRSEAPQASTSTATAPQLKTVTVIGSRRSDLAALDAPAPVDILSAQQIQAVGSSNLAKVLETLVPSVNFPQINGTDGVSSQRPATLRGLAADQVLVLVNGKRRHASAFVNTKATLGRGSQAVDLSTIQVSAIDHIEVLRDGASAQYGSDAIAGVINIVLRQDDHGGDLQGSLGQYTKGDGFTRTVSGLKGFTLPADGFLTLNAEGTRQERTSVGGSDSRQFYPAGDPREASADRDWRYGSPGLGDFKVGANTGFSLSDQLEAYGFATYQDRTTHSQALFRRPVDPNNLPEVYPNGFLPLLDVRSRDGAATAGLKFDDERLGSFDLSATYGQNRIEYQVGDSLNASLGSASPHDFDAGTLVNEQTSLSLDHVKNFSVGYADNPLVFSSGLAWRKEDYQVIAGDTASWIHGSANSKAAGSQGFPGIQDSDEGRYSRHVFGGYLGLEQQLTEQLQLGVAGRSEHYDDFGTTTTGKLSARFDFTPRIGLRGTLSSGYRAPTLGQIGTSATTTDFHPGDSTAYQVGTLSVDRPVARALGASDLKPEKSTNLSLGLVLRPLDNASLSIDAYDIRIKDRIALSETLTGPQVSSILNAAGYGSYTGVSFFTNALDTNTHGLDLNGSYRLDLEDASTLTFNGGLNWSKTEVTHVKANPGALAGTGIVLINREALSYVESASPQSKLILGLDYRKGDWQAAASAIRYGKYSLDSNNGPQYDQTFSAQWVANASLSYHLTQAFKLTVGGNNLFDSYPDKLLLANRSAGGIVEYPNIAPAGAEGAFYYVQADYSF